MTARFPTPTEMAAWPPLNSVDPDNQLSLALAVNIPVAALVTTFITARFYSRTVVLYTLGWDDWIMLAAALLCVGNLIMVIIAMLPTYQMGYHLWDVRPDVLFSEKMRAAQMGMAAQLIFTVVITLTKTAILLTYLRIFPSKLTKWFCYIMMAFTITFNFVCFFLILFQCRPISSFWSWWKHMGTAKCLNVQAIYYFHSAQNTLSDFLIFLWPAKDLMAVKISFRQRVTLISMFSLGVIVCIAGVLRVVYIHEYLTSYDAMWHGGECLISMSVEIGIGIVCGCLPACKPLLSKIFPRIFINGSKDNSYPRPSKQIRMNNMNASNTQPRSGFITRDIQEIVSTDRDVILREEDKNKVFCKTFEISAPSSRLPSVEVTRPASSKAESMLRRPSAVSDTSSDVIILQRSPEDERYWRRNTP